MWKQAFSDKFKGIKITLLSAFIIWMGIYFNNNLELIKNSSEYLKKKFTTENPIDVCLYRTRIYKTKDAYYIRKFNRKIILVELPMEVKLDQNATYEISGLITGKSIFKVRDIRKRNPRFLKLLSSAVTAIAVCCLFFKIFFLFLILFYFLEVLYKHLINL